MDHKKYHICSCEVHPVYITTKLFGIRNMERILKSVQIRENNTTTLYG